MLVIFINKLIKNIFFFLNLKMPQNHYLNNVKALPDAGTILSFSLYRGELSSLSPINSYGVPKIPSNIPTNPSNLPKFNRPYIVPKDNLYSIY